MTTLRWRIESLRIVAVCGDLDVGAIFPPARGIRCRWRAFVTVDMVPAEGTEKNDALAKHAVETRWAAVLKKAKLQMIPPPPDRCPHGYPQDVHCARCGE